MNKFILNNRIKDNPKIIELLSVTEIELKNLFGDKLKQLIVYGSYARGDYDNESDLDIMAIVDLEDAIIRAYRRKVSAIAGKICLEFEILPSIMLQELNQFNNYLEVLPYFQNVKNEGILIYG